MTSKSRASAGGNAAYDFCFHDALYRFIEYATPLDKTKGIDSTDPPLRIATVTIGGV